MELDMYVAGDSYLHYTNTCTFEMKVLENTAAYI